MMCGRVAFLMNGDSAMRTGFELSPYENALRISCDSIVELITHINNNWF